MDALRIITRIDSDTLHIPDLKQFRGHRVELLIIPMDDERDDSSSLSLAGLSRAYGTDEPEYSMSDLREKNPEYAER